MVKLTLDTNRDPVEDLKEAIELLHEAVTRREAAEQIEKDANEVQEERPTLDAGFFKLTVQSDVEAEEPTLNELLDEEGITEHELQQLFENQKEEKKKESNDGFIEIVDVEDD